MRIIEPSAVVEWDQTGPQMLEKIERIGRKCYKSEGKIEPGTAEPFTRMLLTRGHFAMIEHVHVTALIVCDRGVSHEIVRHRIASYAQESTRFCCYTNDRFGREIAVAQPSWFGRLMDTGAVMSRWAAAMVAAEQGYFDLVGMGCKAQEARSVLPNSLKTELYITMNLREWMHFFSLRTDAEAAHPDMVVVATSVRDQFQERLPVLFEEDWFRPAPKWRKILLEILRATTATPGHQSLALERIQEIVWNAIPSLKKAA